MTIENPHDLKKILNAFIVSNELVTTVDPKHFAGNIKFIFTEILKNNQLDEAFFFSIRNIEVEME